MNGVNKHTSYWQAQLTDAPPPPKLPWVKARPPVPSFLRDALSTKLDAETWGGIKKLAVLLGVGPDDALLAAIKTLLFRCTGQSDLIVGNLLQADSGSSRRQLVAVRSRLAGDILFRDLVLKIAETVRGGTEHLEVPLDSVIKMLGRQKGAADDGLFNFALVYDRPGDGAVGAPHLVESSSAEYLVTCILVLRASEASRGHLALTWEFDAELLDLSLVEKIAAHFSHLLASIVADPGSPLGRLNMLGASELRQLLFEWNDTETAVPQRACIHHLFEAQAQRTPGATAVICRDRKLTYAELNARANQLASHLSKLGVGPETLVGLCAERSLEMLIGLLGILKSGGAYVPLDPSYPAQRLSFMIQDAQVKVLLTQERLLEQLPGIDGVRVCLDKDWPRIASEPSGNVNRSIDSQHLTYVIYTSGSTGRPKGVMVEHRNVVNFFTGMDRRIPRGPESVWLAVTSPSFDISVLELFWTLARGFKVVLFAGDEAPAPAFAKAKLRPRRPMEFSLFYFSSDQNDGPGGAYRLLTEGAQFADERGFVAVWTPERHFHEFGGLFPNPSVTSAALAMITKRVQIRSGSVVAPLHSPIRIAEEWSVVDNLSNGRVAISFASGWMPEDFTVSPGNYGDRKQIMFDHLDIVRRLWRGERVSLPGPLGKNVPVKIFPRPVQPELPLWLTAAGNPDTFQAAGRLGINLLTHLLGQSIEEVIKKIALYRKAWKEAGHPGRGQVTIMLHTFVGESIESVKAAVRRPLIEYLRKSADLIKSYAWAFSAFKHNGQSSEAADFSTLPKEDLDALLEHAFDRYFETSGLFGTPESCVQMVERLSAGDIDEIACLIDFGINPDAVLDHLKHLDVLRQNISGATENDTADYSVAGLIERHAVTHLQCTPSMMASLLLDERTQRALEGLQTLMLGGEALPATLAKRLRSVVRSDILNMYGPTETTIWSSTCQLTEEHDCVPVGRPIANTQMYILDQNLAPLPVGIAGELMIGGAGVARGYLGRPELTSERFIGNPFRDQGAHRLYRTGDLARYLADGNIEILGRMDHQVKIRGHRVELGEIEAALNEHPTVRESAVIARDAATGDRQLVAYVVFRAGQKSSRRELRQYLQAKMPEHMVPAQFVFMDSFPQTPNKKTDRDALPPPEASHSDSRSDFEAPSTAVEEELAGMWSELLGVQQVGRNDNFFECGGHSLLAMQLMHRIGARFQVDLPLRNLFERPTIAALAEAIDALSWSGASVAPVRAISDREEVEV